MFDANVGGRLLLKNFYNSYRKNNDPYASQYRVISRYLRVILVLKDLYPFCGQTSTL